MQISQHIAARAYVETLAQTKVASEIPTKSTFDALKSIGTQVAEHAAWGVPLVSATAMGISAVVDKMTAATRKAQAFKSMMDANPHLATKPPEDVQRYFNVLYTMNPDFAKEPTVAASFVGNSIGANNPTMPHHNIFGQALEISRVRKPESNQGRDFSGALERTFAGVRETTSESKKLQDILGQIRQLHQQRDMAQRERSALSKLDEAQRRMQGLGQDVTELESLLTQHGIPLPVR